MSLKAQTRGAQHVGRSGVQVPSRTGAHGGGFMSKLGQAADQKFTSEVMPKSCRLFRSTVPGLDTGPVIMTIEYEDMAA